MKFDSPPLRSVSKLPAMPFHLDPLPIGERKGQPLMRLML